VKHRQYGSNNNSKCKTREYKIFCDGRNCNNIATHQLKIFYFKHPCGFCDVCKQNLEKVGLVESILEEDVEVRGESNIG
jgi:hypothetical protein